MVWSRSIIRRAMLYCLACVQCIPQSPWRHFHAKLACIFRFVVLLSYSGKTHRAVDISTRRMCMYPKSQKTKFQTNGPATWAESLVLIMEQSLGRSYFSKTYSHFSDYSPTGELQRTRSHIPRRVDIICTAWRGNRTLTQFYLHKLVSLCIHSASIPSDTFS